LFLLVDPLSVSTAQAQPAIVQGFVEDATSGERLAFATLTDSSTGRGAVANRFGYFSIRTPGDRVTLFIRHVGYLPAVARLDTRDGSAIVIALSPEPIVLEEVLVAADSLTSPPVLGLHTLPIAEIRALPALLGEADALKALQLLPGVSSGSEGSAGLFVRGGGNDQNSVLLDGAPIYNASHILGFLSVFNTDVLQEVRMIKGGYPARYGGRLSSVVDIDTREGNLNQLALRGSVSPIASSVVVDGPIEKGKSAYLIGARRTYLDALFKQQLKNETTDLGFYFYDVNAKVNRILSDKSRLFLSAYSGKDRYFNNQEERFRDTDPVLVESNREGMSWRNATTSLRLTSLLSDRLFLAVMGLASRYRLLTHLEEAVALGANEEREGVRYRSGIDDQSLRADLDFSVSPRHLLRGGLSLSRHVYNPGAMQYLSETAGGDETPVPTRRATAAAWEGYVEDTFTGLGRWSGNLGVHTSAFRVEGTTFWSVQPRLALQFALAPAHALQGSFTRMRQYVHLLAPSGLGLPTDLWLPSTRRVGPEEATQATLGYSYNRGGLSVTVEGYVKEMTGLLEYREGASFLGIDSDWQEKVTIGEGTSRGVELSVMKRRGVTTGSLAYTLSRTDRRFADINDGASFPYRYDRRHMVTVSFNRQLTERRAISGVWVYGSGEAITIPEGWYTDRFFSEVYTFYGKRGNFRTPAHHRLDVAYRIAYTHKRSKGELSLGAYNLYNRKNPFYIYAERPDGADPHTAIEPLAIRQLSLFPVIPSVAYRIVF